MSTELQRVELSLWNDSDSYKHQQVMADAVKSPTIPASDEQSQLIYIHQPSSASSVTNEDSSGNNNNNSDNNVINNEINMLIEQSFDQQNEGVVGTPRQPSALTTSTGAQYVNAPCGLFPLSLSKTAKTSQISRLKFKFKFLGKFMAKAVMDSRMVSWTRVNHLNCCSCCLFPQLDLPFSIPFYRWLLNEENSIGLADLGQVAPEVQGTLLRLHEIVKQREIIQNDPTLDAMEKTEKVSEAIAFVRICC